MRVATHDVQASFYQFCLVGSSVAVSCRHQQVGMVMGVCFSWMRKVRFDATPLILPLGHAVACLFVLMLMLR